MRDPVRAPSGFVFERATIILWLETRGSVCPHTGSPLVADDLKADTALKTRIMRHHIAKSMAGDQGSIAEDEDPYDF